MDQDRSLDRVTDFLTYRYPALPRAEVAETVYKAKAEPRSRATVTAHLTSLTRRRAEQIRAARQSAIGDVGGTR